LYADLQDLLMGVLHALTATIDAKDPYTCGHSQRVAMLSKLLAQRVGFPPAKVQELYLAGLLHDIGKIGVPEQVLCKEGRLTDEEYGSMKRHPSIGAKILQGIRQLDEVIVGILTHHERPDGKGYPQRLSGAQVPIEGRIVGLADVFDAMTSDRTYRKAMQLNVVLAEIRRCAGTQFDPLLVDLLMTFDFTKLMKDLHQTSQTPNVLLEFNSPREDAQ
jgi:putative nucleotidyltransferase with HDIG domain